MKRLIVMMAALVAASVSGRAQIELNQGESFVYHFDGLQYQGTAIVFPLGAHVHLTYDQSSVDAGDSLRLELFEGQVTGTATAERTINLASDIPDLFSDTAWADLEGGIRITALTGDFTINQVDLIRRTEAPGGVDLHQITVVPEPSTIALAVVGGLALFARRRRKG